MKNNDGVSVVAIAGVAIVALIVVSLGAIGIRLGAAHLSIVTSRLAGQAAFAHSESERKVLVSQAEAELEAAKLRAEAIKIVGEVAQKYPEYRNQEFIGAFGEALRSDKIDQIIYVPTEANIPIIERKR
jgi:hypothetical protein